MRIAYAICNIGFGHSTRSLNIINLLRKRGHEIEIIIGEPYNEFFKDKGFKTHRIHSPIKLHESTGSSMLKTIEFINRSASKYMVSTIRVKKILKRINPDILVSDSEISSLLNSRKIKSALISHQMNIFSEVVNEESNKIWHKFIRRYVDVMIVPDILDMEVPKKIKDIVVKVGPLFEMVKERKSKLKKKLRIKGKTSVFIPSFANTNRKQIIHKLVDISEDLGWNFILLGQEMDKKIKNVRLIKRRNDLVPCEYIKASDFSVVSGYTSLMESVYYQKPIFFIPTQTEQKIIGRLGEKNGILKVGSFDNIEELKSILTDKSAQKEMVRNQKKYRIDGNKQSVEIIESLGKK
ncbi:MAG: hypothetical protein J7L45_03150 [Candidatus Aenigmarchaeota archaeon]|nr:hypothetical protein [Candidatus Aenigmarchaeota archaeon]